MKTNKLKMVDKNSKGSKRKNVCAKGFEKQPSSFDLVGYSPDTYVYLQTLRPGQGTPNWCPALQQGINMCEECQLGKKRRHGSKQRNNFIVSCWCRKKFKSVRGLRIHQTRKGCRRLPASR